MFGAEHKAVSIMLSPPMVLAGQQRGGRGLESHTQTSDCSPPHIGFHLFKQEHIYDLLCNVHVGVQLRLRGRESDIDVATEFLEHL